MYCVCKVYSLRLVEEYSTSVHILPVVLVHGTCPGLGAEYSLVALSSQLRLEECIVLFRFHFLRGERERVGEAVGEVEKKGSKTAEVRKGKGYGCEVKHLHNVY